MSDRGPLPRTSDDVPGARSTYQRLYGRLREAILHGQLSPGSRLPSSRSLAADIGVSRNTVLAAFAILRSEGYIEARTGSGTYVSRTLPEQALIASVTRPAAVAARPDLNRLSVRGRAIAATQRMPLPAATAASGRSTAFQIGLPAIERFPHATWAELSATRLRRSARALMHYAEPAGYRPLRECIANHVAVSRGIRCTSDQVIVVSGSQQALEFCAKVLLDPGDRAWLEDPGYLGARAALVSAGAEIVPVPVDRQGMDVAAGVSRAPEARLAITTPSRQFPLGHSLSLERRVALIAWAADAGSWIVEDDYDSEFRYVGRPLAALQAIDPHERVIYVGTFSKTISPALRLGYLIAPESLTDAFTAAHLSSDVHVHLTDQAVLADFIADGHFSRHVRRMRALYGERQHRLITELRRLGPRLEAESLDGGLHVVARLDPGLDDRRIAAEAAKLHVHAWPLSIHSIEFRHPPALLLGYSGTTEQNMRLGVDALDRVIP